MRKDSLLYIFRCIFSTCPVAGWDIPITPTPPVSSLCRSVGLDKPALLVIRLSFGFVSDSICQAQRLKTNTETAMLGRSSSHPYSSGHFPCQTFFPLRASVIMTTRVGMRVRSWLVQKLSMNE